LLKLIQRDLGLPADPKGASALRQGDCKGSRHQKRIERGFSNSQTDKQKTESKGGKEGTSSCGTEKIAAIEQILAHGEPRSFIQMMTNIQETWRPPATGDYTFTGMRIKTVAYYKGKGRGRWKNHRRKKKRGGMTTWKSETWEDGSDKEGKNGEEIT